MGYNTWSLLEATARFLQGAKVGRLVAGWRGAGSFTREKIGWYSGLLGGLAPSFSLRMLGGKCIPQPGPHSVRQLRASRLLPLALLPGELSLDLPCGGGVSGREPELKVRAPAAEASPCSAPAQPLLLHHPPGSSSCLHLSLQVTTGNLWASQGLEADE